jgi:hypothetical protein
MTKTAGYLNAGPVSEPGTSIIRSRIAKHSAAMLSSIFVTEENLEAPRLLPFRVRLQNGSHKTRSETKSSVDVSK